MKFLDGLSLEELLAVRRVTNQLIRKASGRDIGSYTKPHQMPAEKRHYRYSTLTTYSELIVRRIAAEWYGIDHYGVSKIDLIDMIMDRQETE